MRRQLQVKILLAGGALVVGLLGLEFGLRWRYRPIELDPNWRAYVGSHLVEQSWDEFLARQARLSELRARQGMERGATRSTAGPTTRASRSTLRTWESRSTSTAMPCGARSSRPRNRPGELRILCLGGSTTAGEEVSDGQTYPAQLQAILRARLPGRAIRVINGGVPTYALKQSLDHYALFLRRLDADFVTIYHGINDLFELTHEGVGIGPRRNFNGQPLAPFVFEGDAIADSSSLLGEILVITFWC